MFYDLDSVFTLFPEPKSKLLNDEVTKTRNKYLLLLDNGGC